MLTTTDPSRQQPEAPLLQRTAPADVLFGPGNAADPKVNEGLAFTELSAEQLRLALGEPLPMQGVAPSTRHALELRINAEDPSRGFLPSPGRLTRFRPPLGPGLRIDTHVSEGYVVPPTYDSLVAKLIISDTTRDAVLARARRALGEFELEGIATTIPFFRDMLDDEVFISGVYTTGYIEQAASRLPSLSA